MRSPNIVQWRRILPRLILGLSLLACLSSLSNYGAKWLDIHTIWKQIWGLDLKQQLEHYVELQCNSITVCFHTTKWRSKKMVRTIVFYFIFTVCLMFDHNKSYIILINMTDFFLPSLFVFLFLFLFLFFFFFFLSFFLSFFLPLPPYYIFLRQFSKLYSETLLHLVARAIWYYHNNRSWRRSYVQWSSIIYMVIFILVIYLMFLKRW